MTFDLRRWLSSAAVVAAVAYSSLLLFWMYPYLKARLFDQDSILEKPEVVATWPEAAALEEALRREFRRYRPEELALFKNGIALDGRHSLNPLVEAVFVVGARPVEPARLPEQRVQRPEQLKFEHRMVDVGVRGERLIWSTAIVALIVLLGRDFWKQGTGGYARASQAGGLQASDLKDLDLPNLLVKEVEHCQGLCDQTYARSKLLLRAAIFTVIGALGALYLVPSAEEAAAKPSDPWMLLTRSYGVVLVVNALALVLLRQYRSSAEDHRYMLNLRWRRVNLLAACLDSAKREQVTRTLLAEPYPEERLRGPAGAGNDGSTGDPEEGGVLAALKKMLKGGEGGDNKEK